MDGTDGIVTEQKYFDSFANYLLHLLQRLVHCVGGRSRSPALIVAFLMSSRGLSFSKALSLVKARRPVASVNEGFQRQLRAYESVRERNRGRLTMYTLNHTDLIECRLDTMCTQPTKSFCVVVWRGSLRHIASRSGPSTAQRLSVKMKKSRLGSCTMARHQGRRRRATQ